MSQLHDFQEELLPLLNPPQEELEKNCISSHAQLWSKKVHRLGNIWRHPAVGSGFFTCISPSDCCRLPFRHPCQLQHRIHSRNPPACLPQPSPEPKFMPTHNINPHLHTCNNINIHPVPPGRLRGIMIGNVWAHQDPIAMPDTIRIHACS